MNAAPNDENDRTLNFGCEQQQQQQRPVNWNGDNAFVNVNHPTAVSRRTVAVNVWQSFTRMVDTLSQLSDRTSRNRRNVESPRIGDIVFYVARVIAEVKFNANEPLVVDDDAGCDDYDVDDGIALIRDFFVLTVREFTERYLNDLVERYDVKMREKIFAVKIWLTCRVHFDHQVSRCSKKKKNDVLDKVRVTDRLVFTESPAGESIDILRIETFSPTFAMYTVCDLRDPYDRNLETDRNRFKDECDEVNNNNDKRRHVGAPPTKQNWINLMPSENRIVWYVQTLLLNARETVNRDQTLTRFIEHALNNEIVDGGGGGGSEDTRQKDTAVANEEFNCSGIRTFAQSVKYEEEYQTYAKTNDLSAVDCFVVYKTLLDDLAVQWAKLNVFEPTIFE